MFSRSWPYRRARDVGGQAWRPVPGVLVGARARGLADHGVALDRHQLRQPRRRQRQVARPVERCHSFQQVQVRVHRLHAGWHAQVRHGPVGGGPPVAGEELHVAAVRRVVRPGLEQVEEPPGVGQRLRIARRPRVFRQRVESECLAVQVLHWRDNSRAAPVDLPVEPSVLRVPHVIHQEAVALPGGFAHRRSAAALANQPRRQPQHPRLRHDHLRRLTLWVPFGIEVDGEAAVRGVDAARIPERDHRLTEVLLDGGRERADIGRQRLRGCGRRDEGRTKQERRNSHGGGMLSLAVAPCKLHQCERASTQWAIWGRRLSNRPASCSVCSARAMPSAARTREPSRPKSAG